MPMLHRGSDVPGMKNLAGHPEADAFVKVELITAGIPYVTHQEHIPQREVPTHYSGALGPYQFHRLWYYWSVRGPVPLAMAKEMYAHSDGVTDVRVAGHCGCPPPEKWVNRLDKSNRKIVLMQGGNKESVEKYHAGEFEDSPYVTEVMEQFIAENVFVDTVEEADEAAKHSYIDTYHIDTQEGLNLFVAMTKKYQKEIVALVRDVGGGTFL